VSAKLMAATLNVLSANEWCFSYPWLETDAPAIQVAGKVAVLTRSTVEYHEAVARPIHGTGAGDPP